MKLAIAKAREGIKRGQSPFGACIVKNNEVVACEHNVVWATTNITAHAEVHTIRTACHAIGSIKLEDCVIYSTTEPCPMCFCASHWAGIKTIVFGTRIEDARDAGFNELVVSNETMKREGRSDVDIIPGVLYEENKQLFKEWHALNGREY